MRQFLFEFITGGGLSGQHLPKRLIAEGEIMLQTLLKELIEAGCSDISLCRDERVKLLDSKIKQYVVNQEAVTDILPGLVAESDIAWLIAPETDNCLLSLAELFVKHGNLFIGCSPEAIKITTSKLHTNKVLTEAGIKTIETTRLNGNIPASKIGWIIKPDDGVGGESCYFIKNKSELSEMTAKNNNMLIQPYIKGESLSMSLLVLDDDFRLLGCNKQYIEIENSVVNLMAIGVNECLRYKDKMIELARKIVKTIPGFAGYIGIDMIDSADELLVLDINPRFTTAYAGLSESLGCNVTAKILNTFLNGCLPDIKLESAVPVKIDI